MDQADEELRKTIMKIWPLQSKKMIDLLVPQKEGTRNTWNISERYQLKIMTRVPIDSFRFQN